VFRVDEISMDFVLHVGFSRDGIDWAINPDPIHMLSNDPEVFVSNYSYDPRLTLLEGTYYLTWCNAGPQGPKIGLPPPRTSRRSPKAKTCCPRPTATASSSPQDQRKYAILHRPSDRGHTPFGDIFYATSPDFVHWAAIVSSSVRWAAGRA